MRQGEPLSRVDAAWLRMDAPTNPMVITGVLRLDGTPAPGAVEELVRTRLLGRRRFRQAIAPVRAGRARWRDDATLDLRDHVHRVRAAAPGGEAELAQLVGELMSAPLERDRPLWQLWIVEGLADGSAIVARLHHCVADGVSLIRLLLALADGGAPAAPREVGAHPARGHGLAGRAGRAWAAARSLRDLLVLPRDRATPMRGPLGTRKQAAWLEPLSLAAIERLGAPAQATVNDVILALTAGALKRHLEERGAWHEGLEVRALVPVNLRYDDAAAKLGNRFGLVFVDLPLGVTAFDERLRETKRRMDEIKATPEAGVALGVLALLGAAPPLVERLGVSIFTAKATLLVTNVSGPRAELAVAGCRIRSMVAWAPVAGDIGVSVSCVSYAGRLHLGLAGDAHLLPDPARLAAAFDEELEAAGYPAALAPA